MSTRIKKIRGKERKYINRKLTINIYSLRNKLIKYLDNSKNGIIIKDSIQRVEILNNGYYVFRNGRIDSKRFYYCSCTCKDRWKDYQIKALFKDVSPKIGIKIIQLIS